MDDVLDKLVSTIIDSPEGDEAGKDFESLYKNWGKLGNQEQRRQDLLYTQKSNRNSKLDRFRGILELVSAVEEHESYFGTKKVTYRPNIYVAGFTKTSPTYSNVLMLSEWMIDKPTDFEENWLAVPCPKGVRTLVVASQGTTKAYTKFGHFRIECRTALPGGNPCKPGYNSRCCVLDCFYVESTQTMYILDLLAWNNQPMTDGEAEFRYFWLASQLDEIPELRTINKQNKFIFKLLPKVPCTPKSFNEFMMKFPYFENHIPALDGLLFYHKRAHYVAGETPLVGWLFPFMVPEVIGPDVTINPAYMLQKPVDYVNQAEFIEAFEKKMSKKRDPKKKDAMDTTPVEKNESIKKVPMDTTPVEKKESNNKVSMDTTPVVKADTTSEEKTNTGTSQEQTDAMEAESQNQNTSNSSPEIDSTEPAENME